MKRIKLQILLTGNELMRGDIIDSNSAMIAQYLNDIGLEIERKVTVADSLSNLIENIVEITKQADILIINGGLGPTVDDLTSQALAQVTDQALIEHKQARQHLEKWCEQRNITLDYPNLKQALLPANAGIIANPIGSAVGLVMNFQGCNIYCTPGVPKELELMMANGILPLIKKQLPSEQHYQVIRSQVFGYGEATLQRLIDEKMPDWPEVIDLGFRAEMPFIEVKLACQQLDHLPLLKATQTKLTDILGDHLLASASDNHKTMADYVVDLLTAQNLKITLAESCTGGMIASQLTRISGVSKVFEAGFVTYSNPMKTAMLDVDTTTLDEYGAVSKQVALQMASGALKKAQADIVIAVTGIAGPNGGSIEKPVGAVWIAWGNNEQLHCQYFCLKSPRIHFQIKVANIALDLVRRWLLNSTELPHYIKNNSASR